MALHALPHRWHRGALSCCSAELRGKEQAGEAGWKEGCGRGIAQVRLEWGLRVDKEWEIERVSVDLVTEGLQCQLARGSHDRSGSRGALPRLFTVEPVRSLSQRQEGSAEALEQREA